MFYTDQLSQMYRASTGVLECQTRLCFLDWPLLPSFCILFLHNFSPLSILYFDIFSPPSILYNVTQLREALKKERNFLGIIPIILT